MRSRKKLGVCYVLMVLLTVMIVIPIIYLHEAEQRDPERSALAAKLSEF